MSHFLLFFYGSPKLVLLQVKNVQKKIQNTESAYDVCTEDLFNQVTQIC